MNCPTWGGSPDWQAPRFEPGAGTTATTRVADREEAMTSIKDTFRSESDVNGVTLKQLDAEGEETGQSVRLSPDDCMGLFHLLWTELKSMNFPEMIVRESTEEDVEEGDADEEGRVVFECPRCHAVSHEDSYEGPVEIVDLDIRHTGGSIMSGCTVKSPELSVDYDSETNYELLYVICSSCNDGVRLPDRVTEHN